MPIFLTCSLLGPLASACVFDLRERRIPNKLVLLMTALWAAGITAGGILGCTGLEEALRGMFGGLALGGGALALTLLCERVSPRAVFGGGDVKLLFVLGLYLGLDAGLLCLLFASLTAVVLAAVIPRTRFASVPGAVPGQVPFAPALFIGACMAVLLG